MNDYIWLNATVSSTVGIPSCSNEEIEYNQYLVKKVLSNELTDSVKVSFTLNGTTPDLEIGFLAYSAMLKTGLEETDKLHKLLVAMEKYGAAADIYFETDGTGATGLDFKDLVYGAPTNSMGQQFGAFNNYTVDEVAYQLKSMGASFYFDECLTLRMNYAMQGFNGTLNSGDSIVQIGVLVGKSENYLTLTDAAELRADSGKYDLAYILYGAGSSDKDDNVPNPDYVGSEADVPLSAVDFENLYVNFDLKSTEYAQQFALRPFVVIKQEGASAETSDDTYTVLYGEQYLYGLENYVYNICTNEKYDNVDKITAFRDLLICTWDYAKAAEENYQ